MSSTTNQSSQAALAKWAPLAATAEEAHLGAPLHIVLGEAIDIANLLDHYWLPRDDGRGITIPGFSAIAIHSLLGDTTAQEIRELQTAVSATHGEYLL